jgi:hypothetical protein
MNPKRPPTNADRDFLVRKTPAKPFAVPEPIEDDEVTGKHEGDELAQLRAKRPTHDRIARLEVKSDEHGDRCARRRQARRGSRLVIKLLTAKTAEDGKTARIRITSNGKVTIAIATAAIAAAVTVLTQVL